MLILYVGNLKVVNVLWQEFLLDFKKKFDCLFVLGVIFVSHVVETDKSNDHLEIRPTDFKSGNLIFFEK